MCGAWQLSVCAMGLTCLDHCQPGWNVARPTGPASMLTRSSVPMPASNGRVSSGASRLLRIIPAIAATPQGHDVHATFPRPTLAAAARPRRRLAWKDVWQGWLRELRLTHAAAPGEPWRETAGSPAPMPLSTFVTVRFLANLTVTREPSAFLMCAS